MKNPPCSLLAVDNDACEGHLSIEAGQNADFNCAFLDTEAIESSELQSFYILHREQPYTPVIVTARHDDEIVARNAFKKSAIRSNPNQKGHAPCEELSIEPHKQGENPVEIYQGDEELMLTHIELDSVVNAAVNMLQDEINRNGAEINIDILPIVRSNTSLLTHRYINLMTNSHRVQQSASTLHTNQRTSYRREA